MSVNFLCPARQDKMKNPEKKKKKAAVLLDLKQISSGFYSSILFLFLAFRKPRLNLLIIDYNHIYKPKISITCPRAVQI